MKSRQARTLVFGFVLCSIENLFFPQYNDIISTNKFPFHNPLVMKYYNFLAYFLKVMKIILLLNSVDRLFCTYTVSIQYTYVS